MKLEFETKFIEIECEMEGAEIKEINYIDDQGLPAVKTEKEKKIFKQEFGYLIADSTIPTNVFSAKF